MASWRDTILQNFKPKISRLTLVADPDGLLTEEGMLTAIKDRGFDLIPFDDPIAFRYAYESQYRNRWDHGQKTDLVVVLRSTEPQLNHLPYDLLTGGRPLTFALHQLFPALNYPVLAGLDRGLLDAIDRGYQRLGGERQTERGTKEFVLRHCFRIDPELLVGPVDLLKMLLSLHGRTERLPDSLADYICDQLADNSQLATWPLREIISHRDLFFRFLQEQWGRYLATQADHDVVCEVPFGHEDVRAYIDTYFIEGWLTPIELEDTGDLPLWTQVGIRHDPRSDTLKRYRRLLGKLTESRLSPRASHREWQEKARLWGELVVLRWECDGSLDEADRVAWREWHEVLEQDFALWMSERYGSLYNLPATTEPVMVHQVARFLARERNRRKLPRVVLLVLDGMALDQWLVLRRCLVEQNAAWRFEESLTFAWVPTLTTVTRQAIFAAEPPLYFPESLATTSRERSHWIRFWEDQGMVRGAVELVTNLQGPEDADLERALGNSRLAVLGLVWNMLDDIMHGMQLQTAGMHDQVRLWARQGHLQRLLTRLVDEGFAVYLTADHGNVTARGVGQPREGVLVETKGQRARVYERREFLEEVAAEFPHSMSWPNPGLPRNCQVLLAGGLTAFTAEGSEIVSHGGISLEEVLVPFVTVTRETA
jgi:hypothetical protein